MGKLEGFDEAFASATEELEAQAREGNDPPAQDPPAEPEVPATPAVPAGEEKVDGPPSGSEGGETPPGEKPEDVPESYMGIDLSDIAPETRRSIIDRFKEQDKYVTRVQQRNKELESGQAAPPQQSAPTQPVTEDPPAEPTIEDKARYFGLDPEDPLFEVQQPLVEKMWEQEQRVAAVELQSQLEAFNSYFDERLTAAKQQFGELPEGVTEEDVLQEMVDNNLTDPLDAYHRITAPGRKFIEDAAAEARRKAVEDAKRRIATPRPTGDGNTEKKTEEGKLLSPREALLASLEEAKVNPKDWDPSKATWVGSR